MNVIQIYTRLTSYIYEVLPHPMVRGAVVVMIVW